MEQLVSFQSDLNSSHAYVSYFLSLTSLGLHFHISEMGIMAPIQRVVVRIRLNAAESSGKDYETLGSTLMLGPL